MHRHAAVARIWLGVVPAVGLWLCLAAGAPLGCGAAVAKNPDGGEGATDDGGDGSAVRLSCEGASGTRLRQVKREHGDGSSEFLRLHDTRFAEACSFAPAGDGVLRCLPAVDGTPFAEGAVRYGDLACTVRIAQLAAPAVSPPPRYMREQVPPTAACAAAAPFFYTLGEKLAIATDTAVFQKQGEDCGPVLAPATDFFAIAADLGPDSFVDGTESLTDSGRIATTQVDASDGSRSCRVPAALQDRDLGNRSCLVQVAEDGSMRCLPGDVGASQAYVDEVCTSPVQVALVDEVCNAQAAYLMEPAGASCPLRQRVRALDGALAGPVFVATPDSGCVPAAASPVVHGIGATVSAFSFAEVTYDAAAAGGERLQRVDLVTGDGLRLPSGQWLDTELDVACAFVSATDGAARCLPIDSLLAPTARLAVRFTDAACMVPVAVGERDRSCAEGEPRFVLEQIAGGATRVHEAGPVQPGPLYFQSGEVCVEVPPAILLRQLGAEIPAESFVGGVEMLD